MSSEPLSPATIEPLRQVVWHAALVVLVAAVLGVVNNAARGREGIAWIQNKPYDILVPCPESVGATSPIAAGSLTAGDTSSLVIDARSAEEFSAWHFPDALNIPFDWLGPPVQEEVGHLAKNVAASRARRVVVYGDGDDPDSGREWARLLAGGGIRNVVYVEGGAKALRAAFDHAKGTPP